MNALKKLGLCMVFMTAILMPLTFSMLAVLLLHFLIKNEQVKKYVTICFFILIWVLATPAFSFCFSRFWEGKTRPITIVDNTVQAIVILGGGLYEKAGEYDKKIIINDNTLARLHYGATLYKKKKIPILVTGGDPKRLGGSEGEIMSSVLENHYGITNRWTEKSSDNTFFNAKNSADILSKEGIKKIYLVTHSWHMPRASLIFKKRGFDVVEAPTRFSGKSTWEFVDFLPTADGIAKTSLISKEIIAYIYYRSCEVCHSD
ncbi:MAG: hypothetical protein RL748_3503 [Pseudomonadota bacterium]|jgi:uncharacterized SAM-binding protein YcdF (DUF218 family)